MRSRGQLLLAALVVVLTGCGSPVTPADSPDTASPSPGADSPSPSVGSPSRTPRPSVTRKATASPEAPDEGLVLEAAIEGTSITPNGERVEVPLGEPVVVRVVSDRPGELHVHSTPESFVEFGAGRTSAELSFERPGIVEIEDHDTGFVLFQLQVG